MSEPSTNGFRHYRQLALVGSLVFATLVCLGMFALRVAHSHLFTYRYLIWNLFLAWLRFVLARFFSQCALSDHGHDAFAAAGGGAFLVRPHTVCRLCLDWLLSGARLAFHHAGDSPPGRG